MASIFWPRSLFSVLLLVLTTAAPVTSKSESEYPIYLYVNRSDSIYLAQSVLDIVQSNLMQHNLYLVIVPSPNPSLYHKRNLEIFPQTFYGSPHISFHVVTPYILEPSLVPYAQPITKLFLQRYSDSLQSRYSLQMEATSHLASTLTALALYSVNGCELAIPYFRAALEQVRVYASLDNPNYEYSRSLEAGGLNKYLSFFWGNCELLAQNYVEAIKLYEIQNLMVNELEYMKPARATNLSWAYIQQGEIEKAFFEFWSDGRLDYYIDARYSRAKLYASVSDFDAAIQTVSWTIDNFDWLSRDYPWIDNLILAKFHDLRGQMYLNLYEWDKSLEDFNTAIELAPDYAEAYFQRGVLYYSILQTGQELREEALADFRHYLELAPDGPYAEQAADYAQTIEAELAALNE